MIIFVSLLVKTLSENFIYILLITLKKLIQTQISFISVTL